MTLVRVHPGAPWEVEVLPYRDRDGWRLAVVCKATYSLEPEASQLAADPLPLYEDAQVRVVAGESVLWAPRDLFPYKHRPEIVVASRAKGARLGWGTGPPLELETVGAWPPPEHAGKRSWSTVEIASVPLGHDYDAKAFQHSPPGQWWATLPLSRPLVLECHEPALSLRSRLPVMRPCARVSNRVVVVAADLLWLDFEGARAAVTWRGNIPWDPREDAPVDIGLTTPSSEPRWPDPKATLSPSTHAVDVPTAVLESVAAAPRRNLRSPRAAPASERTSTHVLRDLGDFEPAWLAPADDGRAAAMAPAGATLVDLGESIVDPIPFRGDPGESIADPISFGESSLGDSWSDASPARPPLLWSTDSLPETRIAAPNPVRPMIDSWVDAPAPDDPEPVPAPPRQWPAIELIWSDPTAPERLESPAPASDPEPDALESYLGESYEDEGWDEPEPGEAPDPVLAALRGPLVALDGLQARRLERLRARHPSMLVVVVGGRLRPTLDETEVLNTMVQAAKPLARDKKLEEAVTRVERVVGTPLLDSGLVRDGMRAELLGAWRSIRRDLPPDFLEEHAERSVLAGRKFRRCRVLGAEHLHARLDDEQSQLPVYLPEALSDRLPLSPAFEARLLAEVVGRQDDAEHAPVALRALALAALA